MHSKTITLIVVILNVSLQICAQHNAGVSCIGCHADFKLGGTFFTDAAGSQVKSGETLTLIAPDGALTVLNNSDANGNIHETVLEDGDFLIQVGEVKSRTWHNLPAQRDCNGCHLPGGNGSEIRNLVLPPYHTQVTAGNRCNDCHYFPATMDYERLSAESVLHLSSFIPETPGSMVQILNQNYAFDPEEHTIATVRPDIFAPGFYSMFDVILSVAQQQNIPVEYHYDSTRKTHFITSLNGVTGEYWYHFSYDTGNGNSREIEYRRENRWDEALWRPGVWIQAINDESLDIIKAEYLEEIQRETLLGNVIPQVRIRLNPSDYEGNPEGSGRLTITKTFEDVTITAHNYRATGFESPYSKPFQPGVITSMDILLSLMDEGLLTLVTGAFYTNFASNYIDSYYVVEMGFPTEGRAHASGRQGFTYTTGNGTNFKLAHGADNKFHITSDIAVLHAPDFSIWKWTELGSPYYEDDITSLNRSVIEDHNAMDRGFNLHLPHPNPVSEGLVYISFNIFEPGMVKLDILDSKGTVVEQLFHNRVDNLGVKQLNWETTQNPGGIYYIRMIYNSHQQVRRFAIVY